MSVVLWLFRADRRVSTLTLGRMLTSTSIRSPTVSAFFSKLQLFFPLSVLCLASCWCLQNTFDLFISMFSSFLPQRGRAANSQRTGGEGMKIRSRVSVSVYTSFMLGNTWTSLSSFSAKAAGLEASGEMAQDGEELGQVQEHWKGMWSIPPTCLLSFGLSSTFFCSLYVFYYFLFLFK